VTGDALRIVVDERRCCGAGHCAAIAPTVFDQCPDTGVAVVLEPETSPASEAAVQEAADLCPVGAILLVAP
jgi:ferredoxin